ncbi:hypothetical protein ET005_10560 [Lactococcus petauri]|nr:hypothetical protein [Lactococcus petauri]
MALKETTKLSLDLATPGAFKTNLHNFNNQDILSQNVSQMGATISVRAFLVGNTFSYAIDKAGSYMKVAKNGYPKPLITVGKGLDYRDKINSMRTDLGMILGCGVSIAIISAVVLLCPEGAPILTFINQLNSAAGTFLAQVISSILGLPGNFKTGLLAAFIASLVKYLYDSFRVEQIYNGL